MGITFQRLYYVDARKLLLIMGIMIAATIVVFQLFEHPSASYLLSLAPARKISLTGKPEFSSAYVVTVVGNNTNVLDSEEESRYLDDNRGNSFVTNKERKLRNFTFGKNKVLIKNSTTIIVRNVDNVSARDRPMELGSDPLEQLNTLGSNFTLEDDINLNRSAVEEVHDLASFASSPPMSREGSISGMDLDANSKTSDLFALANISVLSNSVRAQETQLKDKDLFMLSNKSVISRSSTVKRKRQRPTSISQMNSLLLQGFVSSISMRARWLSKRDRELLSTKIHIMNAPIVRRAPGLQAAVFRNISIFKRSYDLMERILKVYIYEDGERPIFHQPNLGGIYASEGWFMKLMEGNKHFAVTDPRRAHLFYIPISSKMLRESFRGYPPNSMETYLKSYWDQIVRKYHFWNRTEGADHFLVACHDWALKLTDWHMRNSIRALCNANVAQGFRIGKDASLPVTLIRKVDNPLKDLGGKPPSQRPILAFFAGSMHGYLRPNLLKLWENKYPDMKILGPMPRDGRGTQNYRENMRSSKYCICARGYEVHTPRVVEAIFAGCVPVIISDNYVPPFFEVLDWEAFSVFVPERDIKNLRNILVSISKQKYLAMQRRVKMVQQHFLWHKKPEKYDLFHMILHSVWYNRVFRANAQ